MAFKRHIANSTVRYLHENTSGVYFSVKKKQARCQFKHIKIVILKPVLEELKLNINDGLEVYIDDENPYLFMFKPSKERIQKYIFKVKKYGYHGTIAFSYSGFTEEISRRDAILTANEDGSFIIDCSH